MRHDDDDNPRGWGAGFFIVLVLALVMIVVVFVLLWFATQNAQTSAIVSLLAIFFLSLIGALLWTWQSGARHNQVSNRETIVSLTGALAEALLTQAQPVVIDNDSSRRVTVGGSLPQGKARTGLTPRYQVNGKPTPLGLSRPRDEVDLEAYDQAGHKIVVSSGALMKFVQLPTPARSEWKGDRDQYGAAFRWASVIGLIERVESGGARWPGTDVDTRVAWVEERIEAAQ